MSLGHLWEWQRSTDPKLKGLLQHQQSLRHARDFWWDLKTSINYLTFKHFFLSISAFFRFLWRLNSLMLSHCTFLWMWIKLHCLLGSSICVSISEKLPWKKRSEGEMLSSQRSRLNQLSVRSRQGYSPESSDPEKYWWWVPLVYLPKLKSLTQLMGIKLQF